MFKHIYPGDWHLNKRASLIAIGKGMYPVSFLGDHPCIEVYLGTHTYCLPLDNCLQETFLYAERDKSNLRASKGFYDWLVLQSLSIGLGSDYDSKYIYLLKCNNYYKIGITDNYNDRRRRYVTENPYVLDDVYVGRVYGATKIEGLIKSCFRHKNIRGEWFEFSDRDIRYLTDIFTSLTVLSHG